MAEYKLLLPAMGEGVMEATIIQWNYKVGDSVTEDDSVVEIATDKVDSDVPTPVTGRIIEILKHKDDVAKIGDAIAILEVGGDASSALPEKEAHPSDSVEMPSTEVLESITAPLTSAIVNTSLESTDLYLSPLVKSIIQQEALNHTDLQNIKGTGQDARITKEDIFTYIQAKKLGQTQTPAASPTPVASKPVSQNSASPVQTTSSEGDEIIEMDRMRKLIADHMVMSKHTSPHVTSFIETDVTNVVLWRAKNKNSFEKRENEKLTFMPVFVKAVVKAIQDFPMINVQVNDTQIIKKKNINIGFAAALPDGNLIVPVIKNADQLSLSGLAKAINDLATRARNKQLKPHETQGGTYTLSNVGTFGNLMGTPIINQPQVAILAVGAIVKKPAVIETPQGDLIGIRSKMFMSHSYDHRVVDGSLGGLFLKRVHDYLEQFDIDTEI